MKDKSYRFNNKLLRDCREERGLTIKFVCNQLIIASGALYKAESGETTPNAIMAYKLAKFYDMSVEDFIIKCKGEAK